jgi:hypothetical protein
MFMYCFKTKHINSGMGRHSLTLAYLPTFTLIQQIKISISGQSFVVLTSTN